MNTNKQARLDFPFGGNNVSSAPVLSIPEEDLMLAILQDAIACYQKYAFATDERAKSLFLDAEAWIMSDSVDALFCFRNICDVLEVGPEFIRLGLTRWRQQAGKRSKRQSVAATGKEAA